jgi:hypothetical protein
VARPPFRPASADDVAALVFDPTQAVRREEVTGCLCLFVVPMHLRSAFWNLLVQAQEHGAISPDGFNAFAAEVARFLAFKELPLPGGAVFELVAHAPGQAAPLTATCLWGLINLGETAPSLVFFNMPGRDDVAPDYAPVRLQLEPGEGVRIPAEVLLGSDGLDQEQPDVLLLIRMPEASTIAAMPRE